MFVSKDGNKPQDQEVTYDANDNMTSQTGKFTDIAYEHRNLPIHFYLDGGDELIANYNAEGQRILKEFSGGAWSFYVTDGMQTLAVITQNGLSHMNLVGGGTFGRIVTNGSGNITTSNTRYYHITDHLGSTRAVVNNSGSLIETFDYYPFGLLMPKRNTASAETREKFTGHERDDEVGLDYMVARMYDPAVARFHGVDPLSDEFPSWSPFAYVFNNPLMFTDPTGMSPVCGESQNCDETYRVGSVVENRLGSWQYVGNNQWETLSLAENVTEITSGAGRAWHRFNNINDHFHDFGDRTIAENTGEVVSLSMMDNAGSWLVGGPARGAALVAKGMSQGTRFVSTSKGIVDLQPSLTRIVSGGKFPHVRDGSTFFNKEALLPNQPTGYYREFVHPTPGVKGPGAMRIVTGKGGEMWFTPDHYKTFIPIR